MSLDMTPKETVQELDKYIIGQTEAKKAVAIALRNRYRRQQLPKELAEEIYPKNIIMIGSTGVGKTEIARRLAKIVNAPFIKVESTKFTEVGYVGRDVESMIRELTENCVRLVKQEKMLEVQEKAEILANERLLDALMPKKNTGNFKNPFEMFVNPSTASQSAPESEYESKREIVKQKLLRQELEDHVVEIEIEESQQLNTMFSNMGIEEMGINFQDLLGNIMPKNKKKKKVTVAEARRLLTAEEAAQLVDMDTVGEEAVSKVEESGIVFLDEIDKIAGKNSSYGPDVSRGGVQRDILPIVEGSTVLTKYGPVKTDHILFIASGAFHVSKPSDLIPELQGRFPIRVELQNLDKHDLKRILTEPHNSLIKQYTALLKTEDLAIEFTDDALDYIAEISFRVNNENENIGARRLHTVIEKVLEDLLYEGASMRGQTFVIDKEYVDSKLVDIINDEDLSKYIL